MITFLLKKTFLHYWDNLYKLLYANLCLALLIALCMYTLSQEGGSYLSLVPFYLFNLLIGATALVSRRISDHDLPENSLWLLGAKTLWKDALFFTAWVILHAAVFTLLIPFYLGLANRLVGLSLAMTLFWVCIFWWVAMIYYYPLRLRLNLPVFRAAHRSLLFLTDNLSLSLAISMVSAVILMLSVVTSMLLPGISFVLIFHQVAGRTILLKYTYLESHPTANRKDIPWNLLLKDDLEIIGKRSLKEILFPWKE